ncbi:MAG: prepilin-type N-terminal cleavage/methylation domain-containing protein [Burkholderiales bacterium]|nr:prepilin-type N-terminal cleavage/methylation domain-containing protein [Burkholderiales bacterium]
MSNSRRREFGMTLIELIVAIVIIGIGLAGVLLTFSTTVRSSADPLVRKQMSAIAEEMMEEILLKPFAVAPNVPAAGCARLGYDDVRDYNGYSSVNICDIDGTTVLSGYRVSVSVSPPAATPVSLSMVSGVVPASDQLTVKVSVTRERESYSLTGWRTCYAGPPC